MNEDTGEPADEKKSQSRSGAFSYNLWVSLFDLEDDLAVSLLFLIV
jgi:hypothetical protein